ncbi:hypothetical protein EVA_08192 [gut metagenome]|uniref:Uncharacterized protein n=1 Tax=gut metagenome TaxID=749906 RepID=J9GTL5_9ZZZZ
MFFIVLILCKMGCRPAGQLSGFRSSLSPRGLIRIHPYNFKSRAAVILPLSRNIL